MCNSWHTSNRTIDYSTYVFPNKVPYVRGGTWPLYKAIQKLLWSQ